MSALSANPSTASFVAPDAPAGAPPIKVTLERKKKAQEVRRVRGDFAFDELVSVVRHMWNSAPKRLAIEYVDDDGDRVVIGSQLEWAEAQRLCAERGDRVIRLFARAGRSKRGGDAGGDSDVSDVEDVDATPAVAAPAPVAVRTPTVPPLPLQQQQQQKPRAAADTTGPAAPPVPLRNGSVYYIKPRHYPAGALDVYYSTDQDGARCWLYNLNRTNAQKFEAIRCSPDGRTWAFRSQVGGKTRYLCSSGTGKKGDIHIRDVPITDPLAQFTVAPMDAGYCVLLTAKKRALDVAGSGRHETDMLSWQPHGGANQQFMFELCEGQPSSQQVPTAHKAAQAAAPQADAATTAPAPAVPAPAPAPAPADDVTLEDDEEQKAHEATVDLLSRLFDCDAAQELTNMFSLVNFSAVATRKVEPATQSVHVDINRAKLRALTIDRTNAWIGNGLYEKAESTLAAATRVWPGEPIFEYNAACSAALRGDVPLAEQHLLNAIQLGFRDASLLREDADLRRLRANTAVFERVTSALERAQKAQRVEAAEAAAAAAAEAAQAANDDAQRQATADTIDVDEANSYAETEVDDVTADADDDLYVNVDEAEPAAPQPAPQPQPEPANVETDVDKLVAVFPQLTPAEAAAMLRRFGTLAQAVQHCLAHC